jgi:hypothetical protein
LEHAHSCLASKVPPPQLVKIHGGYAFRFVEQTCNQAIVQKLARLVTALRAAELLLRAGLTQEQAAIQRIIQEINEDIMFLSYAEITGEKTDLHVGYLEAFYEEEFDQPTALASRQRRPMKPRRKIRAYLNSIELPENDPARNSRAAHSIHSTYSGYVHAASPQLMELFDGKPPRWLLAGSKDSPFYDDHKRDIWNYYFRSLATFSIAAKALGDDRLCASLCAFTREFASLSGQGHVNYTPKA